MSRIAVIGGGIAGLTAAYRLSAEHDVVAFEAEQIAGGKIRSQRLDGFLFEWGPSAFLGSATELRALVDELGLGDGLTPARPAAKKRYIYWGRTLHALPTAPREAFELRLLTTTGKLRALAEPFVPRGSGADDESVLAFMRRRFGSEVAERIVAPALLGISGGDAAQTSLAAMFPRLRTMELEHGSVVRAMFARRRGAPRRTSGGMFSFAAGGMQTLVDRLAERLGRRLHTDTAVRALERRGEGWRVVTESGSFEVDGVIVATPADAAASLVEGFDAQLAARLREIPYAPMRAVGVAFRTADVPVPLDGFGFLAARTAGVRSLGAFFTSTIVPEHAPPDTAYLRIFLGGATDPGIATLTSEAVRAIVLDDLRAVLGISAAPVAYHEVLWRRAIPQYRRTHRAVVASIEAYAALHPRFALAGNAYRGLGLGDNVRDALVVAQRIGAAAPIPAATP